MSRQSHFSAKHYESEATGPFSFLNPTVRRKPLPEIKQAGLEKNCSQDTLQGNGAEEKKDDEISASDVQHKWTSRDNRKGELDTAP